jgi:hypothetical protein
MLVTSPRFHHVSGDISVSLFPLLWWNVRQVLKVRSLLRAIKCELFRVPHFFLGNLKRHVDQPNNRHPPALLHHVGRVVRRSRKCSLLLGASSVRLPPLEGRYNKMDPGSPMEPGQRNQESGTETLRTLEAKCTVVLFGRSYVGSHSHSPILRRRCSRRNPIGSQHLVLAVDHPLIARRVT